MLHLVGGLILLVVTGAVNAAPWPLEIIDRLDDARIVIYVNESDIEQSPVWNPADGAPPFGLKDLMKRVAAWEKKNRGPDTDGIEKIELKPIAHHEKQGRWYYLVQLGDKLNGKPTHRYLAVLMSGKTVAAIREPESYK